MIAEALLRSFPVGRMVGLTRFTPAQCAELLAPADHQRHIARLQRALRVIPA